jgi:uncharacterized membrane protein
MKTILILAVGLGAGLIAGVFFAFSTFVMPALSRLPAAQGVAAMQSINVTVITRSFLGVFVGTAIGCAACAVLSFARWNEPGSHWLIAGAALYLVGTFGVTFAFNIPRNDALASLAAESSEAAAAWPTYLSGWTAWNHVRCIAALLAAACCFLAVRAHGPSRACLAAACDSSPP